MEELQGLETDIQDTELALLRAREALNSCREQLTTLLEDSLLEENVSKAISDLKEQKKSIEEEALSILKESIFES